MTLRIALDQDSGVQVVRLEGWLEGEAVAELERVMGGRAGPSGSTSPSSGQRTRPG